MWWKGAAMSTNESEMAKVGRTYPSLSDITMTEQEAERVREILARQEGRPSLKVRPVPVGDESLLYHTAR